MNYILNGRKRTRKIDLKTGSLSLKNLRARPVRTVCLFIVVAILASTLFGGSILALNLRQGLDTMTKRFGADLMVVPEGSSEKAQALLLRGDNGYFYFDAGIVDKVAGTEGVACASPQFFLTSLSTECCDAAVQLIAYDPATDFVVQPWIAEKRQESNESGKFVASRGVEDKGVIYEETDYRYRFYRAGCLSLRGFTRYISRGKKSSHL